MFIAITDIFGFISVFCFVFTLSVLSLFFSIFIGFSLLLFFFSSDLEALPPVSILLLIIFFNLGVKVKVQWAGEKWKVRKWRLLGQIMTLRSLTVN